MNVDKRKTQVEVLAPAGSLDIMKAVVAAGADAIYLGGNMFGARAFANNFNDEELICAIEYAHLFGRKVYLTVNTLLKSREIENSLIEYLIPFYEAGLDAVIVQDMGVFNLIRKHFPDMDIHASTQMTQTGVYGSRLLKELGATRIVTSREMNLQEIKQLHERLDVEIESFVHGALCYCYSGQCLLSSFNGGRSGNRGRCAQPCRMPYDVYDNGEKINNRNNSYALSPKDMCALQILPDVIESGVYSLKIEGRMKNVTYAAMVTHIYRKYVDMYLERGRKGFKVDKQDIDDLSDIYNRGAFTTGYYDSVKGKKSYGYLPKDLKQKVDAIVDQMELLPSVYECYGRWWKLQCRLNDFYAEKERQRPPLSEQKEFRAIKNAVIQEAEHVRLNHISFEDRDMEDYGDWVNERSLTWTCRELWRLVENEALPLEDRDEAAERLELLAKMGDPYAQTFLGQLYRDGGLLIPDAEKARHWLEQAAERELPQAQYALGKLLLSDDPDVCDPSEGIRWLNAAAQNGNDYTAYALGKEYLQGDHVLKNANTAAEYLHQAAEAQNPWAQYLLGKLYLMGEGVEQDQEVAYGWFQAAAMQGHTYAQFFKERMEQGPPGPPSLMLSATQLLHHMGNIFRDNVPEDSTSTGLHIDHKRLQALQEKRIALGHRPDDHVEQTMGGMTMR